MQLSLPADLERFVDDQVATGAYATREDVLRAAIAALQQAEEFGDFAPGELDALIAKGEESIRNGGTIPGQRVFDELRQRSADRRKGRS